MNTEKGRRSYLPPLFLLSHARLWHICPTSFPASPLKGDRKKTKAGRPRPTND